MDRIICFDTETSGLPKNYKAPVTDINNWPRIISVAWVIFDEEGVVLDEHYTLIKPEGFVIPEEASKIHGITTEKALAEGNGIVEVITNLVLAIESCNIITGHNIRFDQNVIDCEIVRMGAIWSGSPAKIVDTMMVGTDFCKIPNTRGGYKWPKLGELYAKLFPDKEIVDAHNALGDVRSTADCYLELRKLGLV